MNLKELTIEQLDEQIETYQDRIETMMDYISDEDDSTARGVMQGQLQRYRMALQMLKAQRQNRSSVTSEKPSIELSEFIFKSSDHLRYQNGQHVSGPHGGAPRAIKVEGNIFGDEGYTVTMFNTGNGQAVVQMAPKQMKLIESDDTKTILKGYGMDSMGASFADYGLTIFHNNGSIEKCVLHMYDRGVDIEYLK
jgi:hypothetical protein